MGDTSIEWTSKTWNPVRGCTRVSEGCRNCYAERTAIRMSGPGQAYEGLVRSTPNGPRWTGVARLAPEMLAQPLRWRKPQRVFVNSMSDLFHEGLGNEDIAAVFGVMAAAPQHTFQVLTKRPERMRAWFAWFHDVADTFGWRSVLHTITPPHLSRVGWHVYGIVDQQAWPLPNVWLGVSVEDQATADERIPLLLETPAAVRFVSYEPALGPVRFGRFLDLGGLDWIIGGSESGPGHRLAEMDWFRSVRDECDRAAVAFFFKQFVARTFGKVSLPVLDGRQYAEFPR